VADPKSFLTFNVTHFLNHYTISYWQSAHTPLFKIFLSRENLLFFYIVLICTICALPAHLCSLQLHLRPLVCTCPHRCLLGHWSPHRW